jgi:hypothetical protein
VAFDGDEVTAPRHGVVSLQESSGAQAYLDQARSGCNHHVGAAAIAHTALRQHVFDASLQGQIRLPGEHGWQKNDHDQNRKHAGNKRDSHTQLS